MSALGDTLKSKSRDFVLTCKLTVAVDSEDTVDTPTFSVRLEAPSYSEVLLESQALADLSAIVTEYTDWVTDQW